MSFGLRLKIIRKEHNLTQSQLAQVLGLSQTTIANYESTTRFPDETILINIAEYFNVSLDYLLGRTNIKIPALSTHNSNSGVNNSLLSPLAEHYYNSLVKGKKYEASKVILSSVKNGESIQNIYINVFEPALKRLGHDWEKGKISVALEHYFSETTLQIMSQLYSSFPPPEYKQKNRSMISLCVYGEQHSIGLKMLTDLFELDGWHTYYLGVNVPSQSLLNCLKEHNTDLLAVSTTMQFNIDSVNNLIKIIRSANLDKDMKIMVGGLAFNLDNQLWKRVDADGYARNAEEALEVANKLTCL